MRRRTFLAALAWLTCLMPGWSQSRTQGLAELLVGQPLPGVPPEAVADLQLLLTRLPGLTLAQLEETLDHWPEGQAACQRVLLQLIEPLAWRMCDFAHRPGEPSFQLPAAWGLPWKSVAR